VKRKGVEVEIKWLSHYYPLVDLQLRREKISETLVKLGIPYLQSSECDFCPHKDPARWLRSSPETLERLAKMESRYGGQFFFTEYRIPLLDAIVRMRKSVQENPSLLNDEAEFGCGNAVCGV
jgi:hypothetical protein